MSTYSYWGNCSDSTAEDIWALQESSEAISWREFKRAIPDAREKLEEMGAVWDETTDQQIEDSWFLDFNEGVFMGRPAYFIDWSRIEWIWVEGEENPGGLPPGFGGFEGFEPGPPPEMTPRRAFNALERGNEFTLEGPGKHEPWRVVQSLGDYTKWVERVNQKGTARVGYAAVLESHEGAVVNVYVSKPGGSIEPDRSKLRDQGMMPMPEKNPEHTVVLTKLAKFETGKPVRFRFVRSTDRAPFFGGRFGQDIEPAGRYLLEDDADTHKHPQDGWEYGWVEFDSPLVIPFTVVPDEPHYGPAGWKAALSRAYGGKKGKALTRAIRADGYDGIVTVWLQGGRPSYTKEIVDLRTVENPLKPDVSGALAIASISFLMLALGLFMRAAKMRKRRDPGPGRTAAVGNSITAARTGFVSFLDRSLPNRTFTNMGVVSEGTVAIKRRLERNVIGHGFDEVIIEAGINDIRNRNAVEHITAQLQSMVRTAKQAGLKVVLTTLPPWHQEVGKIATINGRIRAQGRHWGADAVVDIHSPLADWRGHLRRELVGDRMGLHPNREGQELIGRTILEAAYS